MLLIRAATVQDAPRLAGLIRELVEYEHLGHKARVTEHDIARDGLGPHPKFRAILAEWNGQLAGYAAFFEFYSTFQGRTGLFLEDLFVRSQFRNKGIGKALLVHVAGIARSEEHFCVRWEVLDWNRTAIEFYRKLGAVFPDEWKKVELHGEALEAVASGDAHPDPAH